MFNISNVLSNVLYADDTCIYLRGSDITALFDLLNVELNSMSNVIYSHNSLYSFKYKTKAFLLNNELILTM